MEFKLEHDEPEDIFSKIAILRRVEMLRLMRKRTPPGSEPYLKYTALIDSLTTMYLRIGP